nr:hypothetical protein [Tanacetum cinerariifolium]
MIGSLMYLTSSRPDIMFAICACARHQVTPKECHLHAVKMIFRYLKGHPKLGLCYPKESLFDLTIVATSTTEAEYVAPASCYGQVLWIQNQLLDYGIHKDHPKSQIIGPVDTPIQTSLPDGCEECFSLWGTIDQTLFIRRQRGDFILVQVYVDDIIFGSSNPQLCREFKALMHEKFQMSAMGEILKKFGYSDVRSSNTPMDKENPWRKDEIKKDVDLHNYRSMIGSLMYLTASRPNIMFAVCAYARHQVTPKERHLHAVKRIFRYLKGHPKLGLWYPKESPFDLIAYSNSDYGGATQDRKSKGVSFWVED